jgi:hypothetical protein
VDEPVSTLIKEKRRERTISRCIKQLKSLSLLLNFRVLAQKWRKMDLLFEEFVMPKPHIKSAINAMQMQMQIPNLKLTNPLMSTMFPSHYTGISKNYA